MEDCMKEDVLDNLLTYDDSIPWWNHGIIHSQLRRSFIHDYKRPGVYLITVTKNDSTPILSSLHGNPCLRGGECRAVPNDYGRLVIDAINYFNRRNETIMCIRHYIVMPDHVHFTVRVLQELRFHLGIYLSYLFKDCSHRLWNFMSYRGESFFKAGYNDRILYRYEQWLNWDEYIADNPRRALLRRIYPQYYHHSTIMRQGGELYYTYGNSSLITYPEKVVVRFTSKCSWTDNLVRNEICRELADGGFVLVSPFVHGLEKALWKEGLEKGWKMIRIVEKTYGKRSHPSKEMHEYCSTGKLLIVSLRKIGERSAPELSNRDICMEMNALAEIIVGEKWRY